MSEYFHCIAHSGVAVAGERRLARRARQQHRVVDEAGRSDGSRPMRSHSSSTQRTCSTNFSAASAFAKTPSARRAARRIAGSAPPPIEDRDLRRWRGPNAERRQRGRRAPWCVNGSPLQACGRIRRISSIAAPRRRASAPRPSNSTSDQPSPRPRTSRPWLSSWTVAASSASRSGWCIGARIDARPELDPSTSPARAPPRRPGARACTRRRRSGVRWSRRSVKPSRSASTARRDRLVVRARPVGLARPKLCAEQIRSRVLGEMHGPRAHLIPAGENRG